MEGTGTSDKAVIVVDMQKDNVGRFCREVIPQIRLLIDKAREKGIPVIFACDSRYPGDFLFKKLELPLRNIRDTEGEKVIADLDPRPTDFMIKKRMLSGFFQSDLDFTLRQLGARTLFITGQATGGCVLKTCMDAFEFGYDVIVPADCCVSPSPEDHEWALKYFERRGMLKPTVEEAMALL
ncbi:MAG: cysteine hydrolase [Deltaproteobacteria bacterium]|nr:cysteine hydrolase [Deltaproteobacteria bacterium]